MLGLPVPSNLEEMTLDELHGLHAKIWAERAELKAKHASIMPMIQAKTLAKNIASRAGFDTVVNVGPGKYKLEDAKQTLALVAKGLFNLPGALVDRLTRIVNSGKDEE